VGTNSAHREQVEATEPEHELLRVFTEHGLTLSCTLREMLNEHYSHRTERRGAGFTQATRHLAGFVNHAPAVRRLSELRLFGKRLTETPPTSVFREVSAKLEREESRLLTRIIGDLVCPITVHGGAAELPALHGELKIGTCSLAEKYFLELATGFVRGKGLANVLISDTGQPLLLEKLNLGDDHSCISVAPLVLNGVELPPGSLFGVSYYDPVPIRKNRHLPGHVIPISSCSGFRFLRLSTLAVSPRHRARAFTAHFQAQLDGGLFAPGETTIDQLRALAQRQL
jgi:hypothetical protein